MHRATPCLLFAGSLLLGLGCSSGPDPSAAGYHGCGDCDRVRSCCEAEYAAEGRDGGTCDVSSNVCTSLPLDIQSEYISDCVGALQRGAAQNIAACK